METSLSTNARLWRWLVVLRSSETKNMWFGSVNQVVLPAQTLLNTDASPLPRIQCGRLG